RPEEADHGEHHAYAEHGGRSLRCVVAEALAGDVEEAHARLPQTLIAERVDQDRSEAAVLLESLAHVEEDEPTDGTDRGDGDLDLTVETAAEGPDREREKQEARGDRIERAQLAAGLTGH